MTFSWTNLPYEILLSIFNHLQDLPDIEQCQLTCSSWSRPAQNRFYQTAILNNDYKLDLFIGTIKRSPTQPGGFVKTLEIGYMFRPNQSDWDELDYMTTLVKYCPNIENLNTKQHFATLWRRLYREHQQGRWTGLQTIPFPTRTPHLPVYVQVALANSSTLKNLFLGDRVARACAMETRPCQMKIYNAIFEKLQKFRKLTELEVRVYTIRSIYQLEFIVDICAPSLESITFSGIRPNGEECFRNAVRDPYEIQDLSTVTPKDKIKKLNCDNLMLTDVSALYMLHKFPNVKHLSLNRGGLVSLMDEAEEDEDYIEDQYDDGLDNDHDDYGTPQQRFDISTDTQVALFKYMLDMKFFDVYCVIAQPHIEVINRLFA